MTDKEIIREQANIDISNLHIAQEQGIITEFGKGKLEALEGIVDFIDSLQEEPVSGNLEEASFDYAEACKYDGGEKLLCVEHFKAGAKWQKEQIMKDTIECKVDWYDGFLLDYTQEQQDSVLEKIGAKVGDKIKVIIIKSE